MLSPDIVITHQVEDARYERDRSVYRYVRLEYYVGKFGPFRLEISKDDFDAGRRDELVDAAARNARVT